MTSSSGAPNVSCQVDIDVASPMLAPFREDRPPIMHGLDAAPQRLRYLAAVLVGWDGSLSPWSRGVGPWSGCAERDDWTQQRVAPWRRRTLVLQACRRGDRRLPYGRRLTARAAGVPVPEVLLVGDVFTAEGERPVMILAAARGRAINATPGLPHADRATAFQNAGHTLARLHTVTTPGFWRPVEDGSWPIQGWNALMEGFVADRTAERDTVESIGFTSSEVDHMIDLMQLYARDFP